MVRPVSSQTKIVSLDCAATFGKVSNKDHLNRTVFLVLRFLKLSLYSLAPVAAILHQHD